MRLIIKRNQADVKGLLGGHKGVRFALTGRCDIGEQEKSLIGRYKVGNHVLAHYALKGKDHDFTFTLTVDEIVAGKTVETQDIKTLLQLEEAMKDGCASLKRLLIVMATFGGEEVFEY